MRSLGVRDVRARRAIPSGLSRCRRQPGAGTAPAVDRHRADAPLGRFARRPGGGPAGAYAGRRDDGPPLARASVSRAEAGVGGAAVHRPAVRPHHRPLARRTADADTGRARPAKQRSRSSITGSTSSVSTLGTPIRRACGASLAWKASWCSARSAVSIALKNYPALIEAFASALAEVREARLVIVGAGDASTLAASAQGLGLGDRVLLCGPRDDIPDVLAAIDVFVHPAIAESFGMVIVEAMAMARPVLSTRVGIAPEVIRPARPGSCAHRPTRARWPRDWARCWPFGPRGRRSARGRRRVQSFTAASMANRYRELYARWLSDASLT